MATRQSELIITCNAKGVQSVMNILDQRLQAIKKRMQEINDIGEKGGMNKALEKEFKQLQKEATGINNMTIKAKDSMKKYSEVIKDLSGAKLKDLKKALQEGKAALNNMSARDPGRQKLVNDLKKIQAQIDTNTGAIKKQQSAWGALGTTMKNLFAYAGIFAGFNKLKSMVEGVFQANLKLSDSLANIRKVSGLSMESINQLYRNIAKIDSRNTIETLNQLAYTGAKLGIGQNYGVQGLTGFVKAAEQVQMALGEDMGEDALPALAKMTEVMGLIPKYGVEQSMQKAASAIFQLGATSTATGTNIVEFSKRLYGLANVSRVSTDDLLALGSAADAMGLMPEVAATAFNKLFTSVQRQHNLIEQSLGMTKGTIKAYYDEGKTMDAIVEIFDRMNKKGNLNLLGTVFKDLGSDGARLVNVMATMADRVDILKKHLITSRDAFKEGEAVIGEYMIQNQTAQAMMERASNLWAKAFTDPEGVDMVKQMAQAWYDLSKSMTQSDAQMKSLHVSISLIAATVETLTRMMPFLIRALMMFGVATAIRSVWLGLRGMVAAIREAIAAQTLLNTAMKSNWFLAIASGIAAALTMLYDYSQAASEAAEREKKRQAELKAAFENSKEAVNNAVKPLERYKNAIDDASLSEKQRMEMVKQFKNDYQDYLDYLGIEIESAVDLAKAYTQVMKVMKQKKAYEERESYRQEKNGENRMDRIEAQAQLEAAVRSFGIGGDVINKQFLEKNVNASTDAIYRYLMRKKYGNNIVFNQIWGNEVYRTKDGKVVSHRDIGSKEIYNTITKYLNARRNEVSINNKTDAMWNSEYKDIDFEHFNIDEFNDRVQRAQWKRKGSLDNEKPDKATLAAAGKAAAERKQALRKKLKDAETESQAIIDKVEEFYRLQEATVEGAVADGKLMRADADNYLKILKRSKNQTLADVRGALVGHRIFTAEEWEKYVKDNLTPIMADQGEWSHELMGEIINTSLTYLHNTLKHFNGKDTEGITSTAFFDKIAKNKAGNVREVARIDASIAQEAEKAMLQYQYVEQAQKSFHNNLVSLGIMHETYEEYVKRMQKEAEEARKNAKVLGQNTDDVSWNLTLDNLTVTGNGYRSNERKMLEQWLANSRQMLMVDPNSAEGMETWLKTFMTNGAYDPDVATSFINNKADWTKGFPQLDKWVQDIDKYLPQIRLFYFDLEKWEGEYYDALKKRDDLQNKRLNSWWEHSDEKKENDANLQSLKGYDFMYKTLEAGQTMGFSMGLTNDIGVDPEIMREQQIFEAKKAIWEQAEKLRERELISEEVYQEKVRELQDQTLAYGKAIAENIQARVDRLQNLVNPIADFAEESGQKLGDMIWGLDSQTKTWDQIWKNMVLTMSKSMLSMASQWATQLITRQLFYRQEEMQEQLHQATLTTLVLTAAAARAEGELFIQEGKLMMKQVVDGEEITSEMTKAEIMAMLGISEGASKTIGTLGWLGIAMIPVITGVLMGLLASALSSAGSETSANTTSTTQNRKLVSGMLTYDKGNVQRFIGQDGKVYTATEEPQPKDGLVTRPIATTVQGQPALVAENGPEIVIGRETTRAIMMNEPQLIKYLANYQQMGGMASRRLFDSGNVEEVATQAQQTMLGGMTGEEARALTQALMLFTTQIQKPLRSTINMYGTDGLYEQHKKAQEFMKKYEN